MNPEFPFWLLDVCGLRHDSIAWHGNQDDVARESLGDHMFEFAKLLLFIVRLCN